MNHIKKNRKKSFILCLLFLFAIHAQAQFNQYRLNHDRDAYYFGLSIGYNYSSIASTRSSTFLQQSLIQRIEPLGSAGLDFGLLGTMRWTDRLAIRFAPSLLISGNKSLVYYYNKAELAAYPSIVTNPEVMRFPATVMRLPVHVKFSADRIQNFRMYAFGGIKYDINLSASAEEYKQARQLNLFPAPQLKKSEWGYELGVGFSIYLPFTVISPEIKISNTLDNVHIKDAVNPYSNVLDMMKTKMIQFTINFEE